jgi:hypothetical protein
MFKRALMIGAVIAALGVGLVRAQDGNNDASDSDAFRTAVLGGTINGTISGPTAGVCPGSGYQAMCPVGPCTCVTVDAASVKGRFAGSGVATLAITMDSGLGTSPVSDSTCQPGFGVATLTTTLGAGKNKVVKSETLNLALSICDPLRGNSPTSVIGGFGIAAVPAPSPAASGWGTVNGMQKNTTLTLKLNGSVTQ